MVGSVQFPLATLLQALARKHKSKRRDVPKLRRNSFHREPKRRFILYCEGENTERTYFEAIKRFCTNSLIIVEIVARGDVPYTLAKNAVKRAKDEGLTPNSRRRKNSFEKKRRDLGSIRPRRSSPFRGSYHALQTKRHPSWPLQSMF